MTREKNWTKILLPLFIVALLGTWVFGATTGKIAGVVSDSETGEPLPGANVLIEGTNFGAAADEEGRYYILNIPVGTYSLRAEVIGYKPHNITDVEVTIDHTTTIDFPMEETVIAGEEVTVTAERPLMRMDNTATRTYITSDQITGVAAEQITELVTLEAGTVGASVRGGRGSGTVYFIDGISLRNPMVGYAGMTTADFRAGDNSNMYTADISLSAELPEFAFSEVEMLTGGYSPEFGNAMDGVVNIATKEGRSQHQGLVRITTEGMLLGDYNGIDTREWFIDPTLILPPDDEVDITYIADADGFGYEEGDTLRSGTLAVQGGRLVMGGVVMDATDIENIHKNSVLDNYGLAYKESTPIWEETRGDWDRKQISYSFSGPLFRNAYYALSGEYEDQAKGRYTNQTQDNYNVLGKLTYHLSARTKLNLSTMYSKQVRGLHYYTDSKYNGGAGGYFPGIGPLYRQLDTINDRFKTDLVMSGVLTQSLGPNSYLTVTLGQYNSDYEQKRKDYDDRDGDGDHDEYLVWRETLVKSGEPGTEAYDDTLLWRFTTEDEELVYIWTQDPTLSDSVNFPNTYDPIYKGEWKIGNEDVLAADHLWSEGNQFGWKEVWTPHYDPGTETWDWTSEWLFVGGYTETELDGAPHPELDEKIFGVTDAFWYHAGDRYRAGTNSSSKITTFKVDYANQVTPIHFLQTGGEFLRYKLDMVRLNASSLSNLYVDEWHRTPYEWALYFRDKIEAGGMIVNIGFRLDSYHLGKDVEYSAVAGDPSDYPLDLITGELIEPKTWDNAKIYVSPRLGISHPITDRDVLHFSYNHTLQRPDWRYFYQNPEYLDVGAYPWIPNPELEPQRTVNYEVGFTHQFTENMKIDFTGYYKDVFGWVQMSRGAERPGTKFRFPRNADFGNVKGFEIALDKRYSNYFSADVNYTFMIANGRLSDPSEGGTYMWRRLIMPRKVNPLDWDQTHTFNANLNIFIPASRNPFTLFGNWRINITERYGSGLPFDGQSRAVALRVPPENDKRRPFTNEVDLRVEKRINFGGAYASLWVDVFNLLNSSNLGNEPDNAEWYLSEEDRDGNGVADHFQDPEGRYHDWKVWNTTRRVKVGIDVSW
ncbi:MAG: carboxypeptidase-like regulatory domain-containing protein [Fidelibacterota bacterium]|nr:MAG: carboxypeptidase-like regulatory domain-containing protein [Candidatus Neomarinimicrobiota bacterium]